MRFVKSTMRLVFLAFLLSSASAKQKVCVIGAGASGLASAKQLAAYPDDFEVVVLERNSNVGGVWIYTDNIDLDEHNLPVFSSMYKYLRTNLPKELMAYPDYRNFTGDELSCVTHETVLAYLRNYTDHFNLRQYIQFNTLVEKINPIVGNGDWRTTKWQIKSKNLDTNETSETTCDAVMVCNGHYFEPRIPKIPGIETFPGKIMHSHVYRKPEDFAHQTVLILGASFSGIDISIEISKFAKTVYLSHNKAKIEGLPSNVIQVAGVVSANGNELQLKDNTTIGNVDTFLYCTGFKFSYPFLEADSGIRVEDNHVAPLYKQLVNVEHPSMSLVGLPLLVLHFPLFHVQARYYVAVLQGKTSLPTKSEMLRDAEPPADRPKRYAHLLGAAQWPYNDELARLGDFQVLPAFYKKGANAWIQHRNADVLTYKRAILKVTKDDQDVEIIPAAGNR